MSKYYAENGHAYVPEYGPSRTKQSFKDSCDINKILSKAQTGLSLSHLLKYPEPVYGEFDGEMDLLTAQKRLQKANKIFSELPSEVRREFDGDMFKYLSFVNDPANKGKLQDLLPAIAKPGSYFPNPVKRGASGAGAATPPADPEVAPDSPPPATGGDSTP